MGLGEVSKYSFVGAAMTQAAAASVTASICSGGLFAQWHLSRELPRNSKPADR
ncbi:unnamed protein product [Periconia digitata]|uniref:Uncharacterized protein n=1 Tax=Periconia digitata TaxID=1303443 RepID=A0A9W4U8C7_9PLEO|nr:unnamed protein product [Periconia digitata]